MTMKPGDLVLIRFPQTDLEQGKLRPALIVAIAPGRHADILLALVTSRGYQAVPNFDELVEPTDPDFPISRLKTRSVIRLARLATVDPGALTEFGNLLETFVVGELRKQASWLDEPVTLGHWRTSDGTEVDLVAEFDDGQVLAFEVKANQRATGTDISGLQQLREALGPRFRAGIVLTTGQRTYTHSDRIHIMPIDRLWQPNDPDPQPT